MPKNTLVATSPTHLYLLVLPTCLPPPVLPHPSAYPTTPSAFTLPSMFFLCPLPTCLSPSRGLLRTFSYLIFCPTMATCPIFDFLVSSISSNLVTWEFLSRFLLQSEFSVKGRSFLFARWYRVLKTLRRFIVLRLEASLPYRFFE